MSCSCCVGLQVRLLVLRSSVGPCSSVHIASSSEAFCVMSCDGVEKSVYIPIRGQYSTLTVICDEALVRRKLWPADHE